ncbi:hypothetical protein DFH07DRAFT_68751 [Mycena maculata]|uniref:Uncharacterized protein n=1 Tax=Mycena maculata TaxID=230809 RepID=A0AAD7N1I2_9AGAR|nr:hypothetical protein DFH07DRAFT_68751 [Mycena maculata]
MNPVLAMRLKKDFPALFRPGISCDILDGWEPILRRLCVDLQHEKDLAFTQVKEKYGGLRVYTTWSTKQLEKRLEAAEAESFETCETCGKDGQMRTTRANSGDGWMFVACQGCFDLAVAKGSAEPESEDSDS